jgi:hypothetical protein
LRAEAARREEDVDSAAERILREHLPARRDKENALATLDRIEALRARMKPSRGAVALVREGRSELQSVPDRAGVAQLVRAVES